MDGSSAHSGRVEKHLKQTHGSKFMHYNHLRKNPSPGKSGTAPAFEVVEAPLHRRFKMRSFLLIGSLAGLVASASAGAQAVNFRTDVLDSIRARASRSATVEDQNKRSGKDRIPPGQLPPAGMCRIWIDGVPPGRQPAPTDCPTAIATKPANARVIYGDQTPFPGNGKGKVARNDRDDDDDGIFGKSRDRDDTAVKNRDSDDRGKKAKSNKGKGKGGKK
jgi:hypothetical protein